jgi:hypothetical protein
VAEGDATGKRKQAPYHGHAHAGSGHNQGSCRGSGHQGWVVGMDRDPCARACVGVPPSSAFRACESAWCCVEEEEGELVGSGELKERRKMLVGQPVVSQRHSRVTW